MTCAECGGRARAVDSRPFANVRVRKYKCDCGWFTWTIEKEATWEEMNEFKQYWNGVMRENARRKKKNHEV